MCARALGSYRSPNIHTSLAVVNRLKLMDSGAIHLIGNRVTEAAEKWQIKTQPGDLLLFSSPNEYLKRVSGTFVVFFILDVSGQTEVSQFHTIWSGN